MPIVEAASAADIEMATPLVSRSASSASSGSRAAPTAAAAGGAPRPPAVETFASATGSPRSSAGTIESGSTSQIPAPQLSSAADLPRALMTEASSGRTRLSSALSRSNGRISRASLGGGRGGVASSRGASTPSRKHTSGACSDEDVEASYRDRDMAQPLHVEEGPPEGTNLQASSTGVTEPRQCCLISLWRTIDGYVTKTFGYAPNVTKVMHDGLDHKNPFRKELAYGEHFEAGVGDNDRDPTIHLQLRMLVAPWFRLFLCIASVGFTEIYYRFVSRVFFDETRLAMTTQGRFLIFSHSARGEAVNIGQVLLQKFSSPWVMLCLFVVGTVGVMMLQMYDNFWILVAGGILIVLRFLQAGYDFGRRRLTLKSNTVMRSFMASDLCATSLVIYHSTGILGLWRRTSSEVRFFFGRYPPREDLQQGLLRVVPDLRLVNTRATTSHAAPEGTERKSGFQHSEETYPAWLWVVFVAQTVAYWLTFYNWAKELVHWLFFAIEEKPKFDGVTSLGVVADFVAFAFTGRALAYMMLNRSLNNKPLISITDKAQSTLSASASNENFPTTTAELAGFLCKMVALAVKHGHGLRQGLPGDFMNPGWSDASAGGKFKFDTEDVARLRADIKEMLRSSEAFTGDTPEDILKKYSGFASMVKGVCLDAATGEQLMAIYPVPATGRMRQRILCVLTLGLYNVLWRQCLKHTHGCLMVTNARVIQVSVQTGFYSWGLKIDSFILDDSLRLCNIEAPTPLPCTWGYADSYIRVMSRLGELELRLIKTKFFEDCMHRMWQSLSMVSVKQLRVRKGFGTIHNDPMDVEWEKYPGALGMWQHLVLSAAVRLRLLVQPAKGPRRGEQVLHSRLMLPILGQTEVFPRLRHDISRQGPSPTAESGAGSSTAPEGAEGAGAAKDVGDVGTADESAEKGSSDAKVSEDWRPTVFSDLGTLAEVHHEEEQSPLTSWLPLPEDFTEEFWLSMTGPGGLVLTLWTVEPEAGPTGRGLRRSAAAEDVTSLDNVWPQGIAAGWTRITSHTFRPPKLAGRLAGRRCVCYMMRVRMLGLEADDDAPVSIAKTFKVPGRPCPATLFAIGELWDLDLSYQDKLRDFRLPRFVGEEVLWKASLVNERPDFLWMKVPTPQLYQTWMLTSRRLITTSVEPITPLQLKIRRCMACLGPTPRVSFTIVPLGLVAGFTSEGFQSLEAGYFKRCRRRLLGRDVNDRDFVSMKLLTRHGVRRFYPEGAAITQLKYLSAETKDATNAIARVSHAFYTEVMAELRAWSTVIMIGLENPDYVIHLVPSSDCRPKLREDNEERERTYTVEKVDAPTENLSVLGVLEKRRLEWQLNLSGHRLLPGHKLLKHTSQQQEEKLWEPLRGWQPRVGHVEVAPSEWQQMVSMTGRDQRLYGRALSAGPELISSARQPLHASFGLADEQPRQRRLLSMDAGLAELNARQRKASFQMAEVLRRTKVGDKAGPRRSATTQAFAFTAIPSMTSGTSHVAVHGTHSHAPVSVQDTIPESPVARPRVASESGILRERYADMVKELDEIEERRPASKVHTEMRVLKARLHNFRKEIEDLCAAIEHEDAVHGAEGHGDYEDDDEPAGS
eukprot:TRINITY_DN21245_c0_g1_i1.p1 TRINITY_DN21245_c0_g1~~TRINITY_DN21245_c0_g1_i1.p1  ORF type:complete len:1588 (-),score=303.51 TRINITY_DN21245_c0_g1_i1:473-5236(-)